MAHIIAQRASQSFGKRGPTLGSLLEREFFAGVLLYDNDKHAIYPIFKYPRIFTCEDMVKRWNDGLFCRSCLQHTHHHKRCKDDPWKHL